MKDKILFWIDSTLYHFGVAKHLQDNFDCELFGIIDISFGKKMFQKQENVKFKKNWYYRDNIIIKNKPNLEYLSSFEKKYSINLWKIIYSDILFSHYNEYYKFKSNEILSIMEQNCRFFERVLDEIDPNFLVIKMTDSSHNQLLSEICKKRGIKVLMLGPTRFGYRSMITEEVDILDKIQNTEGKSKFNDRTKEELIEVIKQYAIQQKHFKEEFRGGGLLFLKSMLQFLKNSNNKEYKKYYGNFGKTPFLVIKNQIKKLYKKWKRNNFIHKNFLQEIKKDSKFVYFPLHYDPERTFLIPAPYYGNQIETIIKISKSLPINYKLLVKEHPMQIFYAWRDISQYKKIMDLPNVELVHPNVSNEEMLKNCSLVITIAGTSGLEAAFFNKPSIVLSDVIYSNLQSTYKIKNIEELPQTIKFALKQNIETTLDLNKFVNKIEDNSFVYDEADLDSRINDIFYYGGNLFEVDISQLKMNKFLEDNQEILKYLALEHIKKIQQHKKNDSM